MCLSKIGKKTVGDEGIGWKVYFVRAQTNGEPRYVSAVRNQRILTDCWMLNQEPTKKCGSKFCRSTSDGKYEHGFHLWKSLFDAILDRLMYMRLFGGTLLEGKRLEREAIEILECHWRGYIAEDDDQVVARQIYVPEHTESPVEGARVLDHETLEPISDP